METWKTVKNYEGLYEVSNHGNVRRLKSLNSCGKRIRARILKPGATTQKYFTVALANGKNISRYVHHLVAEAFLNHTPQGHKAVIDHIDGDRQNNNLLNLRIISNRENCQNQSVVTTSKYPGVCWAKHANKWLCNITINQKTKYLGYFKSEKVASAVYMAKVEAL